MYSAKMFDKEIIFDDSAKELAEELKSIIEKNELLFTEALKEIKRFSFIKDVPNTYYIENLDDFVQKIVDDNFYGKSLTEKLSDFNQCVLVYLGYLITEGLDKEVIKKLYDSDDENKELVDSLGDSLYKKEFYEDVLVKLYFEENGTKADFIEFIKTKNNLEEIISKIKSKYRFPAYNFVLDNLVQYLDECGYFNPENMLEICNNVFFEIREKTLSHIVSEDELNEKLSKLSKIDRKKLDEYFKEFLKEINPDGMLLKIYEDALKKGKLNYDKKYSSSCCIVNDNDVSLEIEETNTIKDFFILCHEFMHYVAISYNKDSISMALEEFPSIFFENYSIDFLQKKGYPDNDIETLKDFRYNDLQEKSFGMLSSMIVDLLDKSKGKEVDDRRLRNYINALNKISIKQNEKLKQLLGPKEDGSDYFSIYNPDEYINEDIDYRTKAYFLGLIKYIEAFKYPISAYIAYASYEKIPHNNKIIEQVINYTLYARKQNFKETMELFGISDKYIELLKKIEEAKTKTL